MIEKKITRMNCLPIERKENSRLIYEREKENSMPTAKARTRS